jgi:hypothetical protein
MALIPKTHKKLREARFFMNWLLLESRTPRHDREDFYFYLSAFLTAARSVRDVLDNEHPSYGAWYDIWKRNLPTEESRLIDFTNGQRNIEVHEQGAKTQDVEVWVPINTVHVDPPSHPAYGSFVYGPPDAPTPEMAQKVYYFDIHGTQEKVVDVCRRYVELVDRMVGDFNRAFPT